MGKRTIRNWQRIPCPECNGIGFVQVQETIYEDGYLHTECYPDCDKC